jgi:hypothetical protein
MWLFVLLGLAFAVFGLAGALRVLPPEIGLLSLGGFFFALVCAVLLGYKSRQAAMEDRSRGSATSMLVMMAGMLKDETDETLERIAARGGPAGDAARLILEKRRAG